ncbi:unnamed protein product [Protopolystoma xenopodis]|uniref:Uncharacterized protein n=1 Tax=Protopolystoma xenopodis TaxID=117903 RepID=A0A3S5AI81_9PLAT|nr:unnamed protein product [Protopolystoma xenopodis]
MPLHQSYLKMYLKLSLQFFRMPTISEVAKIPRQYCQRTSLVLFLDADIHVLKCLALGICYVGLKFLPFLTIQNGRTPLCRSMSSWSHSPIIHCNSKSALF